MLHKPIFYGLWIAEPKNYMFTCCCYWCKLKLCCLKLRLWELALWDVDSILTMCLNLDPNLELFHNVLLILCGILLYFLRVSIWDFHLDLLCPEYIYISFFNTIFSYSWNIVVYIRKWCKLPEIVTLWTYCLRCWLNIENVSEFRP